VNRPVTDLRTVMDVTGRTVVVTGGSGGIGGGIAEAFSQRGANVAILDLDVEGARAEVEKLRSLSEGGAHAARRLGPCAPEPGRLQGDTGALQHLAVRCDVADRASVRAAVAEVLAAYGHIDVLVNNAGISPVKAFLDMGDDLPEWHRTIDVDLHGPAYMTHAVANAMRAAKRGGLVINISSTGGATCSGAKAMPLPGYTAAKAALNHLSRAWAVEFAEYGIRVNCIMPGPTHSRLDAQLTPGMVDMIEHSMLTGRFGEPLEIGALCVFMASAEGAHLNGVVMPHDGGFLCVH
jgi:NAD(P)-dependent dehydrogenase (short-subunit alcohol dehydrogenase family)